MMLRKHVPGYCRHVEEICRAVFQMDLWDMVTYKEDLKSMLKKKVVKIQESRVREQMTLVSKTDHLLMNSFSFDGRVKDYLMKLPFQSARIVFMVRTRMLLTKDNFPGRWIGINCNVCGKRDTDTHLFSCPGYTDLMIEGMSHRMFISLDVDLQLLHDAAIQMECVNERLKVIQDVAGSTV